MHEERTTIIATIGPKCQDLSTIMEMAKAGMDACRLNFSHGNYPFFVETIKKIRQVSKKLGKRLIIIQDLQGVKMRIGKVAEEGIELKKNEMVTLGGNGIPVEVKNFPSLVKKNDPVFIADGSIELRVIRIHGNEVKCRVISGGTVKSRKGINLPKAIFQKHASILTKKDMKDIEFGLKHKVDYMALSFVSSPYDIQHLKNILRRKARRGRVPKIIAKIERKEAIKNLEPIVKISDAVMVARGDLGIEVPSEMVPLYQKKIIHIANEYRKPVIVATQMLASMIQNRKPTRAEISDAANAIFDGASTLMLSDETAVGKYPVEAVKVLSRVAVVVEKEMTKHPQVFARALSRARMLY